MKPLNFFLLATLFNMRALQDLDSQCQSSLTRLRDVLTLTAPPTNPQDIQLMLYSGKSPFDLGSKSLCELNPEMQYMTINGAAVGVSFYVGTCMYGNCTASYLNQNKDTVIDAVSTFTGTDVSQIVEFQFHDEKDPHSLKKEQIVGFIFTFFILIILGGLCILGTIVEHTSLFDEEQTTLSQTTSKKTKTKIGQFLDIFSLTKNIRVIFEIAESKSAEHDESLQIFAGVRTLSMMYVVFGHIGITNIQGTNYNDTQRIMESSFGLLLQGGFYAVDCFFLMSGFLAGYLLLKRMRDNRSCVGILEMYFHRWCRLVPSLAMCTLFALYIVPYLLEGPLIYNYKSLIVANCNDYWWSNLLFINNFVPWAMFDECIPWVWYLANDFQFFLLTPPLIILTLAAPRCASFFILSLILTSIGISFYITFAHNIIIPDRNGVYFDDLYSKPYTRVAAYLVGFLIGILYRQNKDSDTRGCGFQILNRFKSSLIGWISAIAGLMLTSIIIFSVKTAYECGTPNCWSLTHSAFFVAFSHPGFAFALMMVLLPLLYGRLSWVRIFLSWGVFRVIGRLTYCAYLVHLLVIIIYALSQHSSNYISKDNLIFHYFGLYSLSYMAALGLAVIIEVPCARLQKLLRQIYGATDEKQQRRKNGGEVQFTELKQS